MGLVAVVVVGAAAIIATGYSSTKCNISTSWQRTTSAVSSADASRLELAVDPAGGTYTVTPTGAKIATVTITYTDATVATRITVNSTAVYHGQLPPGADSVTARGSRCIHPSRR